MELKLSDDQLRALVTEALFQKLDPEAVKRWSGDTCRARLMRTYAAADAGLYRAGVTEVPEGTITVDTTSGENRFLR